MADYPIEAYLRPIHEYYAAFVHACCALLFLLVPEYLMLSREIGYGFCLISTWRALVRFRQGYVVHTYQTGLWRYKEYSISRKKLPVSTNRLFLGQGFKWNQKHTQRLSDIHVQSDYGETPRWYEWAHDLGIRFENTPVLGRLTKALYVPWAINPLRPSRPPNDSGEVALHALGTIEGDRPVFLPDAQRTGHLAIFGPPGVGKSVLIANMARQDIAAGHVTIVLDPKGDAALLSACYDEAVRSGRESNFHCFHLGYPEYSSGYSPIGTFSRVTEVASRLATLLPGDGQSLAFREFVWRQINVIAQTVTAMGNKIDITDIGRYAQNIDPLAESYLSHYLTTLNHRNGAWEADIGLATKKSRVSRVNALSNYYQEHRIEHALAESLIYYVQYDRSHMDKLTGSLLPLIDKLTTGRIAELLAPDYDDANGGRSVFSWPEVIRSGGVVYIGLDSLTDAEVSSAVGNSMFADLTSTLGDIYKHGAEEGEVKICVYADEFAELVGDQFVQLLNKGRGAGLRITTGAQTVEDLAVGFGSKDKADQALGNFNSLVSFRAKNEATAELLTNQVRDALISEKMIVSSARDTDEFISTNEQRITTDRVKMLEPSHIAALPPGEAFAYISGGMLYKFKIPLIKSETKATPSDVSSVINRMKQHKATISGRKPPTTVPVNIKKPSTSQTMSEVA